MRKLTWLLVLLMILTAVPHGAAVASPEQTPGEEVVVGKFIFGGYWDVWGANGKWTNNTGPGGKSPGGKNLTCESDPVCPSGFRPGDQGLKKLLARYELTRAEVKYVYPFGEAEYNDAGQRYGKPWGGPFQTGYYEEHYARMPDNPRATIKSFDRKTGATVVEWTIDYPRKPNPADPKSQPEGPEGYAADIKDWLKKGEWDKIDLQFASKAELEKIKSNKDLEGWRVYFPAVVWWYGIPKPEVNLVAVDIDPGTDEPEPGQKYNGTVTFANDSAMALEDVPVAFYNGAFRGYLKDFNGNTVTSADFAAGEEKTFKFTWTAPGSGDVTLKGVIDTPPLPDNYAETDESDNIVEAQISVIGPPPPSGPGSLTFTAVSQSGKYARPPGTAKWTDWVTATLTVPEPTPPKGTLKSWSITSARLTYPKKHPWFTFGSPWPPQGAVTINMTPQGHKATAKFQEDWSLNGAPVYARYVDENLEEIVDEGMVPGPTYFTITATYTVQYTYEYQVRHVSYSTGPDGKRHREVWYETKTGSGTDSGTASGRLLVNGTGVNSVAG